MRLQLTLTAVFVLATNLLSAQTSVSYKRSDGKQTPMQVYAPTHASTPCAPLAVISHGAGGSEFALRYLAQSLSADGYTAIVMGHRESGLDAVKASIRASRRFRAGVQSVVTDENAEAARLLDVGAALAWSETQCHAPFRVLLGHSMGAETTMFEAGARNMIGIPSPPSAQDRFDAYIPLSPEGPGVALPDHAWTDLHKPVFILTGTNDQSLKGGPQARLIPYAEVPSDPTRHCHWQGVITGATHADLGGNGEAIATVEPIVTAAIRQFLQGVRAGACSAPPSTDMLKLSSK